MRKYKEELVARLQNDSKSVMEDGVEFIVKPIPEIEKTSGMDPRMLKAAKEKIKNLPTEFSIDAFQLYGERYRPDKKNYDLTENTINTKQKLIQVNGHYINTFFYYPDNKEDMPIVLYIHGGAFMTGDHTQFENQCRFIAEKAQACVVFPEYRLAPENPFPAGIEDAFEILNWIYDHADELNGNKNKIVVAGDSAGASIANACALMDQEHKIRLLFEIYPCCDIDNSNNPKNPWDKNYYDIPEDEEKYIVGRMKRLDNSGKMMRELYLGKEKLENPYASIIYQKDLSDFPPVVTVVGEYDFLRFSTDIFTKKCVDYGKLRRTIRYQGCDHGFFDMIGVMPQAEDVILEMAKDIMNL